MPQPWKSFCAPPDGSSKPMPRHPKTWRWAINGALVGFLVSWIDMFVEWRDVRFAAWSGSGIAYNLAYFAGSVMMGALIGSIAGAVHDRYMRRAGLLLTKVSSAAAL